MVVLFDLDGTLTDPFEGITTCVQTALQHFGIEVPDRQTLAPYIGPPLKESFMRYHGLTADEAQEALQVYRARFGRVGLLENRVYDGIPDTLAALRGAGHRLAVATSKPTVYATRIVAHFSLAPYFETVVGSELDGRRVDKAEVVAEALRCMHADATDTWMVGDRCFDVQGAHQNGVRALGVRYGYAAPQELETAGADAVADTVEAMGAFLLSKEAST